jgi:hypothetical protein
LEKLWYEYCTVDEATGAYKSTISLESRMETVWVQMSVIWGFAVLMVLLERNKSKG